MVVGQQHLLKAAGGMMLHQIRSSGIKQRHDAVERDHSATGAASVALLAAGAAAGRAVARRPAPAERRRCRLSGGSGSSCHLLFIPVDPLRAPRAAQQAEKFIDRLSETAVVIQCQAVVRLIARARSRRWAISSAFSRPRCSSRWRSTGGETARQIGTSTSP